MTTVNFKYPNGIDVLCKQTGLKGSIASRGDLVNGCIRYSVQPKKTDKDASCPDQWYIDEQNIKPIKGKHKSSSYTFKYRTGDKVKSLINGFTGIIVERHATLNGCEEYMVEGDFSNKDNKRVRVGMFCQEIKYINSGLNEKFEPQKAYVGCVSATKRERF